MGRQRFIGVDTPATVSEVLFADRADAGRQLVPELRPFRGQDDVVVVGIPRGGVLVAREVALGLGAPLAIWVAQKLQAPANPDLAIGALAEDGEMILHEELLRAWRIPATALVEEVRRRRREVARQAALYHADRPEVPLVGKRVVVVDDGLASGATLGAALRGLRRQRPASIMVAVPVAPARLRRDLPAGANGLRTLAQPSFVGAFNSFYAEFEAVTDEQVLAALREPLVPFERRQPVEPAWLPPAVATELMLVG